MPLELPPEIASTIPAEHLSHESIQRYSSPADLIKGHIELQDYRGRSIGLPKQGEDLNKWRSETGEKLKGHGFTVSPLAEQPPANPDAYDFKVEGVDPEHVKTDTIIKSFRPLAHKLGINNATANELIAWYNKDVAPILEQRFKGTLPPEQDMIEEQDRIDKIHADEFGDKTDVVREQADRAISAMSKDIAGLTDAMEGYAPLGGGFIPVKQHPAMIKAFAMLGEKMQQDFGGNVNGSNVPVDSAAATEATDIMNNPNNAKHKLYRSGDPHTQQYVDNLLKKAYGEKEVTANEFLPKIIDRTGTRG